MDAVIRALVALYLCASACSFLVAGILFTATYAPGAGQSAVGLILCAVAVAVGLLTACGRVWVVTCLSGIVVLTSTVMAIVTGSPPFIDAPHGVSLFHLEVLLPILVWSVLRHSASYRRHVAVQILFMVIVAACSAVVLTGSVRSVVTKSLLASRHEPIKELNGSEVGMLRFEDENGKWVTLDQPDIVYVVCFWATDCAPCVAELPRLVRLQSRLEAAYAARVLLVLPRKGTPGSEFTPSITSLVDKATVLFDRERWAESLGVRTVPCLLFVHDGDAVDVLVGRQNDLEKVVETKIRRVLFRRGP